MVFISNRGHEDDLATSVTPLISRIDSTDLLARQVFPSSLTAPCVFLWKLYTVEKDILPRIEEGQCLVKGILEAVHPDRTTKQALQVCIQ